MNDKQFYVIEKIWKYKPNLKLDDKNLNSVLIRPCDVSYDEFKKFIVGKDIGRSTITYGASEASWFPTSISYTIFGDTKYKTIDTFEKFMIYVNLEKFIYPIIENDIIEADDFGYQYFFVKTIDLKTGKVLCNDFKRVMKQLNEQRLMTLV